MRDKKKDSYSRALRDYFLIGCNDNELKLQLDFTFEAIYNPIEIQPKTAFEIDLLKNIYTEIQYDPSRTNFPVNAGREVFENLVEKYKTSSSGIKFYADAYTKASKDYNNDKRFSPYEKKRLSFLQSWINKGTNAKVIEITPKERKEFPWLENLNEVIIDEKLSKEDLIIEFLALYNHFKNISDTYDDCLVALKGIKASNSKSKTTPIKDWGLDQAPGFIEKDKSFKNDDIQKMVNNLSSDERSYAMKFGYVFNKRPGMKLSFISYFDSKFPQTLPQIEFESSLSIMGSTVEGQILRYIKQIKNLYMGEWKFLTDTEASDWPDEGLYEIRSCRKILFKWWSGLITKYNTWRAKVEEIEKNKNQMWKTSYMSHDDPYKFALRSTWLTKLECYIQMSCPFHRGMGKKVDMHMAKGTYQEIFKTLFDSPNKPSVLDQLKVYINKTSDIVESTFSLISKITCRAHNAYALFLVISGIIWFNDISILKIDSLAYFESLKRFDRNEDEAKNKFISDIRDNGGYDYYTDYYQKYQEYSGRRDEFCAMITPRLKSIITCNQVASDIKYRRIELPFTYEYMMLFMLVQHDWEIMAKYVAKDKVMSFLYDYLKKELGKSGIEKRYELLRTRLEELKKMISDNMENERWLVEGWKIEPSESMKKLVTEYDKGSVDPISLQWFAAMRFLLYYSTYNEELFLWIQEEKLKRIENNDKRGAKKVNIESDFIAGTARDVLTRTLKKHSININNKVEIFKILNSAVKRIASHVEFFSNEFNITNDLRVGLTYRNAIKSEGGCLLYGLFITSMHLDPDERLFLKNEEGKEEKEAKIFTDALKHIKTLKGDVIEIHLLFHQVSRALSINLDFYNRTYDRFTYNEYKELKEENNIRSRLDTDLISNYLKKFQECQRMQQTAIDAYFLCYICRIDDKPVKAKDKITDSLYGIVCSGSSANSSWSTNALKFLNSISPDIDAIYTYVITQLEACLFFCTSIEKVLIKSLVNMISPGNNYMLTEDDKKYPVNKPLIELYVQKIADKLFLKMQLLMKLVLPLDIAKKYKIVCDKFKTSNDLPDITKQVIKKVMSAIEGREPNGKWEIEVSNDEDILYNDFQTYYARMTVSNYRAYLAKRYKDMPNVVEDSPKFKVGSNKIPETDFDPDPDLDAKDEEWDVNFARYMSPSYRAKQLAAYVARVKQAKQVRKKKIDEREEIRKKEQKLREKFTDKFHREGEFVRLGSELLTSDNHSEQVAKVAYVLELGVLLKIPQETIAKS